MLFLGRRAAYVALLVSLSIIIGSYMHAVRTEGSAGGISVDGLGYDWSYESVDALDGLDDDVKYNSFYEDSRDVMAVYYAADSGGAYWRVDLLDLAYGAETASGDNVNDALDLYILIGWANAPGYQGWLPDYTLNASGNGIYIPDMNYQWVLAVCIYDTGNFKVMDYNWNTVANQSTGTVSVALNNEWDIVEVGVSASVLQEYGWSQTTQVWYRVYTTWSGSGHKWIDDPVPDDDNGFSDGEWNTRPVFSTDNVGTAKLAFVHHGNQALTDNRALNNPNSKNSYGYILWVHEDVSRLAGRTIPVGIHMSGTLASSFAWWDMGFIDYIKSLISEGVVEVIGGVWAEHITAYFDDSINRPSIQYYSHFAQELFGVTPNVAWIPERTWDDERTGIALTLVNSGIKGVILDGNTHHDDWASDNDHYIPHRYDLSKTGGANLWVFFIDWDMQQKVLSTTDGGANIDLRRKWLWFAREGPQNHVLLYADDWEKAAGVAGWDTGNPDRYEETIRWIAQHPWIQVVKLSDVINWLESGSWGYADGFYCGYDTYQYIKGWVNDYPYDYRRAYDGWYWGTSTEESYANLGPSSTPQLRENIKRLGDIWTSGTVIGDLYNGLQSAPDNDMKRMALITFWSMLHETAWHDESDWDNDGLQDVSGWEMAYAQRIRYANVFLEAADWLNSRSSGVKVEDIDWDGVDEVVLHSDRVYAVIDLRGGAVPWLIAVDGSGNPYQLVGPTMDYYTGDCCRDDAWNGDTGHVGLFDDKWLSTLSKDYSYDVYVVNDYGVDGSGCPYVNISSPDGVITKVFRVCGGSDALEADYKINSSKIVELGGSLPTDLYIRFSASPDVEDLLIHGDDVSYNETYGPGVPYVDFTNPSQRLGKDVHLIIDATSPPEGASVSNVRNYQKWTLKYVWEFKATISSEGVSKFKIVVTSSPVNPPQPIPENAFLTLLAISAALAVFTYTYLKKSKIEY